MIYRISLLVMLLLIPNNSMATNQTNKPQISITDLRPLLSIKDYGQLAKKINTSQSGKVYAINIPMYMNLHPTHIENINFSYKNHLVIFSGNNSKAINSRIITSFLDHQQYVNSISIDPECPRQFDVTDYQINKYNNDDYKAFITINSNYDCQAHAMTNISAGSIIHVNDRNIIPTYKEITKDINAYNQLVSLFLNKASHIIAYDKDTMYYNEAISQITDDIAKDNVIFDGKRFIIYDNTDLLGLCYTCDITSLNLPKAIVFPLLKKEYVNIFLKQNKKYQLININHD